MKKSYKALARIFSGNRIIGYKVLNLNTSKISLISIEETVDLIQQGLVINLKYSSGAIKGNGIHLSELPRIQQKLKTNYSNIVIYTGDELLYEVNRVNKLNRRDQFSELYNKTIGSPRITCLYGLRRTGKTVLLFQLAGELIKHSKKVIYITINKPSSTKDLFELLDQNKHKYDYIIIDEIAYLSGLSIWASRLEFYNSSGTKLIISGTQSYAINLAENSTLFDRIDIINTTYISYREYARLFKGATLQEYIQNGGVLEKSFLSNRVNSYITTSIVDNILDTIESIQYTKSCPLTQFGLDRSTLSSVINQLIYNSINYKVINKYLKFKDNNLQSALQLLESYIKINDITIQILIDYVAYNLRIGDLTNRSEYITNELIEYIVSILKQLDFIEYKNICNLTNKATFHLEIGFNQPGIRYNQSLKTLNGLYQYRSSLGLTNAEFSLLNTKLIQDISGRILKEIITIQLIRKYGRNKVYQIKLQTGAEIDIAIETDNGIKLYEVKLSNKQIDNQARWLVNKDLHKLIENILVTRIISKNVIYTGKTITKQINGFSINYINAEEFLLNI